MLCMRAEIIVLNSRDKKRIKQTLKKQFDSDWMPNKVFFCLNKKEKVYSTNRDTFDVEQDILRTNAFGNYFGTIMIDGFRLSIEGSQLFGPHAKKGILHVSQEQRDAWIMGHDLEIETKPFEGSYVLICYKGDFYGCGKAKKGTIMNYVPKSRKLKKIFDPEEKDTRTHTS